MEPQQTETHNKVSTFYNNNYKKILIIPIILLIISLAYIGYFYSKNGDIMLKDSSLTGGTTITLIGDVDTQTLESQLKTQFSDVTFRKITNSRTGKPISTTIETSANREEIASAIEKILDYKLTTENSSIEFTGPSLSASFYKQLMIALIISFLLMSFVIFLLFRTFIPSIAVIFSVFADIVMPLALLNFLGIKISAAGIAAFLMLIGYSVDTDLLLTTRALRGKAGHLNQRLFRAFKTGSFMTITALIAVIPSFFIVSALPDSFRQIFLILALGLFADLVNTWLTNMSIIKWYCEKKRVE
ncbi:MAG: MMPL family transporter [Nanoarchaeota archaeon]